MVDFYNQFCLLDVILSSKIVHVLSNHHASFHILFLIISPAIPDTLLSSSLLASPYSNTYFFSSSLHIFSGFSSFLFPLFYHQQLSLFTVLFGFLNQLSIIHPLALHSPNHLAFLLVSCNAVQLLFASFSALHSLQ